MSSIPPVRPEIELRVEEDVGKWTARKRETQEDARPAQRSDAECSVGEEGNRYASHFPHRKSHRRGRSFGWLRCGPDVKELKELLRQLNLWVGISKLWVVNTNLIIVSNIRWHRLWRILDNLDFEIRTHKFCKFIPHRPTIGTIWHRFQGYGDFAGGTCWIKRGTG